MKDEYTCEPHGIENCPQCRFNPEDKQQSTNEEIRQSFKEEDLSDYLVRDKPVRNFSIKTRIYTGYELGYKARDKSAQAEIEWLKDERDGYKENRDYFSECVDSLIEKNEKQQSRIRELEQSVKDLQKG